MNVLAAIENSGFSIWIRESPSVWAYPTVLFLHTIGLGFLVGSSMVIDLRILGFVRDLPLEPLKKVFPVMWAGFWVNAASGIVLVMIDATKLLGNPLFYIKLSCIAVAVVTGRVIWNRNFRDSLPGDRLAGVPKGRALAVASLFFWVAAITAGRLTAYLFANPS